MNQTTLRDSLAHWQAVAAAGKRPATRIYHAELVKIFETHFPGGLDCPAAEIPPGSIAAFVTAVAHYSAPRFNAVTSLLRLVVPQSPKIPRLQIRPKIVDLPGQTQFARLLTELDQAESGHAGLLVRFLSLTGLRIGEARRLTWGDVRPEGILVPGHFSKTGRARVIPLVAGLPEALVRLRAAAAGRKGILPQKTTRKALASACERAGVPRLSHHDFRRLYATRCIECGVDMPTVARWMGHADGGALLAKTYFHLNGEHSRKMALKVDIAPG